MSVNYWLTKVVQEVTKPSKECYPPRTLYSIAAGIRHVLAEKKPGEDINPLSTSDKRYDLVISTKARALCLNYTVKVLDSTTMNFVSIFDAEMKDAMRAGVAL